MGLFGGRGDKRQEARRRAEEAARKKMEERRKELERIVRGAPSAVLPGRVEFMPYPTDYREFLKEIRTKPLSLYEKAADFSKKILPVKVKEDFAGIDSAARAGYLTVDAAGVTALTLLVVVLFSALTVILMAAFPVCTAVAGEAAAPNCITAAGADGVLYLNSSVPLFMLILAGIGVWLVWGYPKVNARAVTNRISADSVLAVLYMVIYMRTAQNLEGALRFAAENLSGPLSWDLKKLIWDIQLGVWPSADTALANYSNRWREENEEFSESINLLRGSAVTPERRAKLYDEVINLILKGTAERTKKYVLGLRMPVMLIHAMGVLLPVIGLVLFPIVLLFMAESVKPIFLFLGYDVLLPLFLWIFVDYILRARPPTFSQPDISLAKGIPPIGRFGVGNVMIPVWPLFFMFAVPMILIPLAIIGGCLFPGADMVKSCAEPGAMQLHVNLSILPIIGLGGGLALVMLLDSYQKMSVRKDIEKIEGEFSVALFQLGSQLPSGVPIELAVQKATVNMKGLKIADLFSTAVLNMQRFGMTFEQSLFDKEVGAVWYWPSRLVRSTMGTIVEASRKGMAAASEAMLTISSYLKGVHEVGEEVEESLGETISSMKFLAMFLAPLVAGVTVTMAIVMIQILTSLGAQFEQLPADSFTGVSPLTKLWGSGLGGALPISAVVFQIIVGLYMLETIALLSYFVNRIQYGDDAIGLRSTLGSTLLMGLSIYIASWFVTYMVFGSSLTFLLQPVTT